MTTGSVESFLSAVVRRGYRLVYLGLRVWWFLRRPATNGAAVALWHQGRILLVRTSYRNCLSLPGGFVRRGEPAEKAALRELHEEVGIRLPEHLLRHAWHGTVPFESRQDTIDIWEATLDTVPALHPTGREIVWADWVTPAEALKYPLLPHLRAYLYPKPE